MFIHEKELDRPRANDAEGIVAPDNQKKVFVPKERNIQRDIETYIDQKILVRKIMAVLMIIACNGFFVLMVIWLAINAFRNISDELHTTKFN